MHSSILLFFMQLLMLRGNPLLPPMRHFICCRCATAHHHRVPFRAYLLLFCVSVCCALSHQPIGVLRGDQSAAQHADRGSLGPRGSDNDGENKKGEERQIKECMPPLPGQTLHYRSKPKKKKKKKVCGRREQEESFSQFCHRAAFTGLCFNVKDSAVSHVQLIRNQRLWLISENESQKGAVGLLRAGATLMSGVTRLESAKAKANLKLEE